MKLLTKLSNPSSDSTSSFEAESRPISKTAQWAKAHKWSIELADPELQKRCKSYKDGKKVKLY